MNKATWRERLYKNNWKKNILKKSRCGDCGVEVEHTGEASASPCDSSELHEFGCDMER